MMVLAEPANDWWWYWGIDDTYEDETNIHAFDISEPANTEYIGSGRVKVMFKINSLFLNTMEVFGLLLHPIIGVDGG